MSSVDFGTSQEERLERLRAQLRGRPVGARAAQRTQAPRGAALLWGVMLHAASRLEAGLELTDLEARMVAPLRLLFSQDEVQAFGRLYREETAARSTAAVLPDAIAARPVADGYAMADLAKDLPGLREEIRAQANVSIVDLDAAPAGDGATYDTEEFNAGQAAYGYGVTMVTASAAAQPAQDAGVNASIYARVDLHDFLCERESDEFSVDDEIYWGLSVAGPYGDRQERLTRVYTNIDRGERHAFEAGTTLYQGYVTSGLVCNIQCWEEDDGGSEWMNQLQEKLRIISEELRNFVELMEVYGDAFPPEYDKFLGYVEMAANIAYIISWLIDLFKNPDDLVQERTILFDQAALRSLATTPYPAARDWVFDGGSEGRHVLRIKWVGSPPPADAPGNIEVLSPASSQWGTPTRPRCITGSGPAVAVLDGSLHAAVRGTDNVAWVGKQTGTTWSNPQRLGAQATTAAPSLAVHDGKLYLGTRDSVGNLYVTALNGLSAGPSAKLPGRSSTTPALASRGGTLHCAVRGTGDNSSIYFSWLIGTTWNDFQELGGMKTFCAPALATHQDKLYLAYTDLGGVVKVWSHDAAAWSATAGLPSRTASAPALGVRNGVLYCAYRSLDAKIVLHSLSGTTWSDATIVPGATTMSECSIAGGSGNTLHIAYRSTT